MNDKRAFVTGSRAYGSPHESSDIDLVVFLSLADLRRLVNVADEEHVDLEAAKTNPDYIMAGGFPLRFGSLNLLCVTDEKRYEVWLEGTRKLKRRAKGQGPVKRDVAVKFFREARKAAGFRA